MNDDLKNSLHYLNSKTNKENGFTVPSSYFKNFEDALLTTIEKENSGNNNPFKIPENYFEEFEDSLFEKLPIQKKEVKVVSLYKRAVRLIPTTMAASVLLFLGYTYFNATDTSINFNNVSYAEIEKWYESGYINAETDDFLVTINETDINFENETINSINLNSDDVEEYLNTLEDDTILNEIQ